jgi:hypothetical protein
MVLSFKNNVHGAAALATETLSSDNTAEWRRDLMPHNIALHAAERAVLPINADRGFYSGTAAACICWIGAVPRGGGRRNGRPTP